MRLIYFPINRLAPTGGPAGYLYNLKLGLDDIGVDYCFLPPDDSLLSNKRVKSLVPEKLRDARRFASWLGILRSDGRARVDLRRFDSVHFHSTLDMYVCRRSLDNYNGRVVLTSHSPCVLHKEMIENVKSSLALPVYRLFSRLSVIDEYAFDRADTLIFPCEQAEEPYYHTWPRYAGYRDGTDTRYVATGIQGCHAATGSDAIRERYGIPKGARVLSYVGRHNEVKGFTDLKAFAEEYLANHADVWFLIAGREKPVPGLNHERWIEVGWTDDPHSIIASSDAFILPNRETYFDLVFLEVLSLGVPIFATRTGGNRYFEQFESPGITLYGGYEELSRGLDSFFRTDSEFMRVAGRSNREVFDEHFTCQRFAQRYVETIEAL